MGLGSGIRDPGSGKNLFRIPDPGSRGQKGTGSRIRIRNTAWMNELWKKYYKKRELLIHILFLLSGGIRSGPWLSNLELTKIQGKAFSKVRKEKNGLGY
jgi:hypothetical protein